MCKQLALLENTITYHYFPSMLSTSLTYWSRDSLWHAERYGRDNFVTKSSISLFSHQWYHGLYRFRIHNSHVRQSSLDESRNSRRCRVWDSWVGYLNITIISLLSHANLHFFSTRYLTTLRQELIEEKRSITLLRRHCRKRAKWRHQHPKSAGTGLGSFNGLELDDVALKTTGDLVRRLIRRFKEIEKPFLAEGEAGIQGEKRHGKQMSASRYDHPSYGSPNRRSRRASSDNRRRRTHEASDDYDVEEEEEEDDDRYWAQRVQYAGLSLSRRWRWIHCKPAAEDLFAKLSKVQIRRMSQQIAGMAILMHEHGNLTLDMDEQLNRIDARIDRLITYRWTNSMKQVISQPQFKRQVREEMPRRNMSIKAPVVDDHVLLELDHISWSACCARIA